MTASLRTTERAAVENSAHVILGSVAVLMAIVMGAIALASHVGPASAPAAAGEHVNPVAAAAE